VLGRTVAISGASAIAALVLSYPVAYWLCRSTSVWRGLALSFVILSLFIVPIARVFSWALVLGTRGFVNTLLVGSHLVQKPVPLMYNNFGVILVLTHYLLPLTTLTLMASLARQDPMLEWASYNLGIGRIRTFLSITLPLSFPGILAAAGLAFALNMSTFTTPVIIGGGKVVVLANTVYDAMLISANFPLASTLAVVALVMTLCSMAAVNRYVTGRRATS
jgi:putative spermidine/putrescine transport system permease protein